MVRLLRKMHTSSNWAGVPRQVVSRVSPSLPHSRTTSARQSAEAAAEQETTDTALLPADLIRSDETIIFAIKPSLWYVVFDSVNWLLAGLCLTAAASFGAELVNLSEPQFMSAVLAALSLRIGLALLRWASRFYVLTNRRIVRVRGVTKPDIYECPLVEIRNSMVNTNFPEALTGLGTISFVATNPSDCIFYWSAVSNTDNIHEQIRKAIKRAIDCQPHI